MTGAGNGRPEISNIIVPNGTPGYEAGEPYRKMGWNASDTRPLTFDDCRVPEENLLGPRGHGFKQFMQILDGGRIGVAAMGVGLAQGALDEAIAYAKERKAFGQPISQVPGDPGEDRRPLRPDRGLAPAGLPGGDGEGCGTELHPDRRPGEADHRAPRRRASEEAVQIHGGYGYIEEYPVCRFYRDAKILTIGEGTDEVQQMVIARALGC